MALAKMHSLRGLYIGFFLLERMPRSVAPLLLPTKCMMCFGKNYQSGMDGFPKELRKSLNGLQLILRLPNGRRYGGLELGPRVKKRRKHLRVCTESTSCSWEMRHRGFLTRYSEQEKDRLRIRMY